MQFRSSQYTYLLFFFFNDTATTEIYTLSLHDALPICPEEAVQVLLAFARTQPERPVLFPQTDGDLLVASRSEEHTSELQSRQYLVCRLLLEKKKKQQQYTLCNTKTVAR